MRGEKGFGIQNNLSGFFDDARPNATRAGLDSSDGAVDQGADRLKVGVGALLRFIMGVADIEADQPFFFAIKATSCHKSSVLFAISSHLAKILPRWGFGGESGFSPEFEPKRWIPSRAEARAVSREATPALPARGGLGG